MKNLQCIDVPMCVAPGDLGARHSSRRDSISQILQLSKIRDCPIC